MTEQFKESKQKPNPLKEGKEWWREFVDSEDKSPFWEQVRSNTMPTTELLRYLVADLYSLEEGRSHLALVKLSELRSQCLLPVPEELDLE